MQGDSRRRGVQQSELHEGHGLRGCPKSGVHHCTYSLGVYGHNEVRTQIKSVAWRGIVANRPSLIIKWRNSMLSTYM